MNIDPENIAAIVSLGYTPDEARFLYIVAMHSGYFVPRQFLVSSGAKWGKRSNHFAAKLESRGHATWREYDRTGGVYHLVSKTIYRRIGNQNLRNRRRHSVEFIRTRLLLLDFVLTNPSYAYLETEPDKLRFFCEELGIPRTALPAKTYEGSPRTEPTLRYFVDKFPLFVDRTDASPLPVVTFSYVDPGQASLAGFANHLHVYLPLFRQTRGFLLPLYSEFLGPLCAGRGVLLSGGEGTARSRCFKRSSPLLPGAPGVGVEEVRIVIHQ